MKKLSFLILAIICTIIFIRQAGTSSVALAQNLKDKTPVATQFSFKTITLSEKTSTTATIAVSTNQNSRVTILYGKNPTTLTNSTTDNDFETTNFVQLNDLEPETTYYFKAQATNNSESIAASDIFTFTTAVVSQLPSVNLETLIATSQDKVILDGTLEKRLGSSTIIVPKSTTIEIRFAVNRDAKLKRIVLNVNPKNVLGANTFTNIEPPETGSSLIEMQKGIFYGRLKAGNLGTFELLARIEDENGNIVEQKVADIRVLEPIKVINTHTRTPIEGARVSLSFFNLKNNQLEFISPASLAIKNPSFSNSDGTLQIVLPPGKYQAKVESFGYKTTTVDFDIGVKSNEKYPLIELSKSPFTLGGFFPFILNTITDMFYSASQIFATFSLSARLLILLNTLTFLFFIILLLLTMSLRNSVRPFRLPQYLIFHATSYFRKPLSRENILKGTVVNRENGYGIEGIFVYIHSAKNKIIAHTVTNSFGEFYIKVPNLNSYKVSTMHPNYKPSQLQEVKEIESSQKIYIEEKNHNFISKFLHRAGLYGGSVLSDIIELLLVVLLLLEVLFMINLGFLKTLPFVSISLINLLMLLYFRRQKEEARVG